MGTGKRSGRSWERVQVAQNDVGARRIAVQGVDDGVAPYADPVSFAFKDASDGLGALFQAISKCVRGIRTCTRGIG